MQESRGLIDILKDLQRRRVFRTVVIYAGISWLVIQVADTVFPAVHAPYWAITALVGLTVVGFPIVAVLSWLFDVKEGGIRRTKPGSVRGAAAIVVALVFLVVGTTGFTWLVLPERYGYEVPTERLPNSIAVLAFDDYSPDQSASYLGEGVSEILIHQLAQIGDLHVIARKSAFSFKGTDTDAREIGRRLNVETVLEGSVQKIGDELRITAQLINTETGSHLWSKMFEGSSDRIFEFQDDIADAVVQQVLGGLQSRSDAVALFPESLDLDAYELYLIGRQKFSEMAGDQAIPYFEQAIAKRPDFALAYAGLGEAIFTRDDFQAGGELWRDAKPPSEESYRAIEKAEQLAPDLAEVITARMMLEIAVDSEHETIKELYRKAVNASPNYVWAHFYYAAYLMSRSYTVGSWALFDEAEQLLLKARSLDPMNSGVAFGLTGIAQARGNDERANALALEAYEFARTRRAGAGAAWLLAQLAYGYGNLDQAVAYTQIGVELSPDTRHIASPLLGRSYVQLQDYETAKYWYDQATDPVTVDSGWRGELYWAMDDREGLNSWTDALLQRIPGYSEASPEQRLSLLPSGLDKAFGAYFYRAVSGDCEKPLEIRDRIDFEEQHKSNPYAAMIFANCLNEAGDAESAQDYRKGVERFLQSRMNFESYNGNFLHTLAEAHAWTGNNDLALELIEKGYERGIRYIDVLERDYFFGELTEHPRYLAVLDAMRKDVDRMRGNVARASINDDWYSLVEIEPKEWLK